MSPIGHGFWGKQKKQKTKKNVIEENLDGYKPRNCGLHPTLLSFVERFIFSMINECTGLVQIRKFGSSFMYYSLHDISLRFQRGTEEASQTIISYFRDTCNDKALPPSPLPLHLTERKQHTPFCQSVTERWNLHTHTPPPLPKKNPNLSIFICCVP